MLYDWQRNSTLRQTFSSGQTVRLNEAWSGYPYLQKEYGHLFPARIVGVGDGVSRIKGGKMELAFANQCLDGVGKRRRVA